MKRNIATKASSQKKELKLASIAGVPVTNTSKTYFPKLKITKGDVIEYYDEVSSFILPYLKDRPESLKRNPNGIADKGFFQKDAPENVPPWIKTERFHSESAHKDIDYILCNDEKTLIYLANLGCIEFNPWHSTIQKPDYPDYLILDIDPSPKNSFDQVIETAIVIKGILDKAKVKSYCKTSGASGMHIYVPLQKKYDYKTAHDFAEVIANLTVEHLPKFTSVERSLSKRGNKIYVDYMQNRRGQTIASPYSLRPVEGATVSTPLEWNEVKRGLRPSNFTIKNIFSRLEKKGDLFKSVLGKSERIDEGINRLLAVS